MIDLDDDDDDGILDLNESTCTSPSADFRTNAKVYWSFDNNTNDTSQNGYNENISTIAPAYSIKAIEGTHSAGFDGSTNVIRYSQDGSFMESTYTHISFSAWILPTNLSGDRVIYEEDGITNGFMLWLDDVTLTATSRNGGKKSETSIASAIPLELDNLWHHVACTPENGKMAVYLDGALASTNSGFTEIQGHPGNGGIGCG